MASEYRELSVIYHLHVVLNRFYILRKGIPAIADGRYAQADHQFTVLVCIAHKIAVQVALLFGFIQTVCNQCKMVHTNFYITTFFEQFPAQLMQLLFDFGRGKITFAITALSGLNPGHMRIAVKSDTIRF
ncbi:hypothetical protein D3C87_1744450 [compost metagenome]